MDPLSLILLLTLSPVAAYVIGAVVHILIDQVHGKKLVSRYYATTKRDMIDPAITRLEERITALGRNVEVAIAQTGTKTASGLRTDLDAAVARLETRLENEPDAVAALESELEAASARALEGFLRSESGKTWARELGDYIQTAIEEAFVQRTSSLAGASARRAQSQIERLLSDSISFGNPIMDGLWAAVPRDAKRQFVNRISRVLRQRGASIVFAPEIGDQPEQPQDANGELEALPAGPSADNPWWAPP